MRKICTLKDALDYNNEDVIFRFVKVFDVSEEQSILLFEETKKWFWLCYKVIDSGIKTPVFIDDSILIIDEMWHNFILFTKDYERYCVEKFGFFIHHLPTTKSESEGWSKDIEGNVKLYLQNVENQYSIIFDLLGKETLLLWYKDFPVNYSKKKIKKMIR